MSHPDCDEKGKLVKLQSGHPSCDAQGSNTRKQILFLTARMSETINPKKQATTKGNTMDTRNTLTNNSNPQTTNNGPRSTRKPDRAAFSEGSWGVNERFAPLRLDFLFFFSFSLHTNLHGIFHKVLISDKNKILRKMAAEIMGNIYTWGEFLRVKLQERHRCCIIDQLARACALSSSPPEHYRGTAGPGQSCTAITEASQPLGRERQGEEERM